MQAGIQMKHLQRNILFRSVMPNEDRIVYAKWEAADMTYNVVDYVEGTDGVYTAASSKQETAKTDDRGITKA